MKIKKKTKKRSAMKMSKYTRIVQIKRIFSKNKKKRKRWSSRIIMVFKKSRLMIMMRSSRTKKRYKTRLQQQKQLYDLIKPFTPAIMEINSF